MAGGGENGRGSLDALPPSADRLANGHAEGSGGILSRLGSLLSPLRGPAASTPLPRPGSKRPLAAVAAGAPPPPRPGQPAGRVAAVPEDLVELVAAGRAPWQAAPGPGDGAPPAKKPRGKKRTPRGAAVAPGPKAERLARAGRVSPVVLTVFRDGRVLDVDVRLGVECGGGTDRIVHWCGAQMQEAHRNVRELGYLPEPGGVYVSRWHHGSPAHRYGLYPLCWVTHMNGAPVPDLDTFVRVLSGLGDRQSVAFRTVDLQGKTRMQTIKQDLLYWPSYELRLVEGEGRWQRTVLARMD